MSHRRTLLSEGLAHVGVEVLAEPATVGSFARVLATLHPEQFGAFGELGDLTAHWDGLAPAAAADLHALADSAGKRISSQHPDCYNGVLPRLLQWATPGADAGGQVLVLGLGRTTFATWRVTNGNPNLAGHLRQALAEAGGPTGAHHLPVCVSCVTKDGVIMLVQRASGMEVHPDAYGAAANGNVDLEAHGDEPGDVDAAGTVDVVGAALREAREELGIGIDLDVSNVRARALVRYSDSREWGAPVLLLAGVSALTLAQIIQGLAYAHPTEGAGEIGRHVLAVPARPVDTGAVVSWLLGEHARGAVTAPAMVSTLLALVDAGGHEAVVAALECPVEVRERPQEVRRVPVNGPSWVGGHPVGY